MQLTTRVLLLHSNTLLRQGVVELLKRHDHLHIVGQTADVNDLLQSAKSTRPHVIVMEVSNGEALDACRSVSMNLPQLPVVVLGASRDLSFIMRAFRAGGTIYVPPDVAVEELVLCIDDAHRRGREAGPYLARATDDQEAHGRESTPVSRREREILLLISQGKANKEIGRALAISENTVRNHIANIFGKLGVKDRAEAAAQAIRRGLV